jgi:glucose/arabinose dehydrogenase
MAFCGAAAKFPRARRSTPPKRLDRTRRSVSLRPAVILAAVAAAAASMAHAQPPGAGGPSSLIEDRPANNAAAKPAWATQTRAPGPEAGMAYSLAPLAKGLTNPWGMALLPDGRIIVTERPGRVRIVGRDGTLSPPLTGGPTVLAQGIGGLFDVRLDPAFAKNRRVYLSFNEKREDLSGVSIFRGALKTDGSGFDEGKVIFRAGPGVAKQGDLGGRMLFDRTGALLLSLGDEGQKADVLQALDNDLGKIVRIDTDGAPAKGNPKIPGARPEIYAYGLRDPQGLFQDPKGRLFANDHGPQGGDELNLIKPGANYGWPIVAYGVGGEGGGATAKAGVEQPAYYWDPSIGPSGGTVYGGKLFGVWRGNVLVAALTGKHVARLVLKGDRVVAEERLFTELNARIRTLVVGPDGAIYLLTDGAQGAIMRVAP